MILAVLIAAIAFLIFYLTRPLVVFYVGALDESYVMALDKPAFLTPSYKTIVLRERENFLFSRADLVINHSVEEMEGENVIKMSYDILSLAAPKLSELSEMVNYIYDSANEDEMALLDYLNSNIRDVNAIEYASSIERADYGILSERLNDGIIVTINLANSIGFIRSLENRDIAITYLDAAALENNNSAEVIFAPDWDGIIRGALAL